MIADLPHESDAKVLPGDDDDGDEPNVEAVEWSTDSQYLFTGGLYDGTVRVWRVADWSVVGLAQGQKYNRQVEYMAINPENILATGGDEGFLYLLKFNPPVINEPIQR
jgi:WD40 repeat protein